MPWCSENVRLRMMIKEMEDSDDWVVVKAKRDDTAFYEKIREMKGIFYPPRFESEFKKYTIGDTDFYCLRLSDRISRNDLLPFL
ncbi:hypothetical protein AKJ51_00550 [candidate division MSBL1 archaeon SCGC-AAA382A20]|uniref:Uncharacterized protein n=1 Tax=candidate division MSBL1 archaeon SCGC-AAA382A20 TaxID=1698280 RepID=A0A133VMI6_9EURY|nr:hypothetical protein AKJ51_00550 [candidate division MSBL1 archaeon SCGC-AAA382A20]